MPNRLPAMYKSNFISTGVTDAEIVETVHYPGVAMYLRFFLCMFYSHNNSNYGDKA